MQWLTARRSAIHSAHKNNKQVDAWAVFDVWLMETEREEIYARLTRLTATGVKHNSLSNICSPKLSPLTWPLPRIQLMQFLKGSEVNWVTRSFECFRRETCANNHLLLMWGFDYNFTNYKFRQTNTFISMFMCV